MSLILDGTNGLSDVDGSAATPAIRGTDTNTGIFFPAADTIAFSEGGTEVARFDSSGNLGIGETSPAGSANYTQLAIRGTNGAEISMKQGATTYAYMYCNSGAGFVQDAVGASGKLVFQTNSTERMRIDSSGRVTMPYQPSFHVRVNNGVYSNTSPIPFSNAVFDVGSNFNTSTYRFTAPIAGKYYFVLNIYFQTTDGNDNLASIRVNGGARQYSYHYNTGTGGQIDSTISVNAVFALSAGDYVDITKDAGGGYYGGNQETNFFGWLIG